MHRFMCAHCEHTYAPSARAQHMHVHTHTHMHVPLTWLIPAHSTNAQLFLSGKSPMTSQ